MCLEYKGGGNLRLSLHRLQLLHVGDLALSWSGGGRGRRRFRSWAQLWEATFVVFLALVEGSATIG